MTITLADVYMLVSLKIIGSMQPYDFLSAGSKKLAKICGSEMNQLLEKKICGISEYVVRKIHLLRVILWSDL